MTAETLQPGPLSPGMVSLLTAGRSVLLVRSYGDQMRLATFLRATEDGTVLRVDEEGQTVPNCWGIHRFSYIGERSDDGWITAPPGGWKSNPVGDARVQLRYDFGSTSTEKGSVASQIVEGWWKRTEAFRLVDEATGESGSSAAPIPTEPVADRWADLERLAKAATPGPWNDSGTSVDDFDADCSMRMEWMPNGCPGDGDEDAVNANYRADAAFIAAANPSTVLELIAAARAKEAGE